jgi:predicted ribosomally synthesized peptide with SipW-like signal peptide
MKKKVCVIALLVICLAIAAYGTSAYFTYEQTATNVITSGSIKVELQEWSDTDNALIPFKNVEGVLPGTEVSKIVQVKNIGGQAAWVRVSAEKAIHLAEGVDGEADLSLLSYDLNTAFWTEKDGFYYYNNILQPSKVTEPLFTKVGFSATMSNMYQNSKAVIDVTAQATQVANNGTCALDAAGWPEG